VLAVCFEEDKALKRGWRACGSSIFVEGMLTVERIGGLAPGECFEFGGGVEVDVRVDYGILRWFGHFGKCMRFRVVDFDAEVT